MKNSKANQLQAVAAILLTGLCAFIGAAVSLAANKSDAIAFDPCVLVTPADLRTVLGVSFPTPDVASDVESRACSYVNDKYVIQVFTGNEELIDFQKDSNDAKKKNDSWGKTIKIGSVSAPHYQDVGNGRLVVWKNKTRFTVAIQELTSSMSDEALETAREKLINIGLSRIN
jgi:hypothetical protein